MLSITFAKLDGFDFSIPGFNKIYNENFATMHSCLDTDILFFLLAKCLSFSLI